MYRINQTEGNGIFSWCRKMCKSFPASGGGRPLMMVICESSSLGTSISVAVLNAKSGVEKLILFSKFVTLNVISSFTRKVSVLQQLSSPHVSVIGDSCLLQQEWPSSAFCWKWLQLKSGIIRDNSEVCDVWQEWWKTVKPLVAIKTIAARKRDTIFLTNIFTFYTDY